MVWAGGAKIGELCRSGMHYHAPMSEQPCTPVSRQILIWRLAMHGCNGFQDLSLPVSCYLHCIRSNNPMTATHSPHFGLVRSPCKTPLTEMLDVGLSLRSLNKHRRDSPCQRRLTNSPANRSLAWLRRGIANSLVCCLINFCGH